MWYDPLMKKTVIYGGIGRSNLDRKVTRHADMWAFDGSVWTLLEVPETPGQRMGAAVAVHPVTGKVLLFGGLRAESLDDDSLRQYFANDTWQWDGSTSSWTRLESARVPEPRQNAGLAWDPAAGEFTLFGGYSNGFYHSDVWSLTEQGWIPRADTGKRRRAVR
jgi:N-acetylneuraminic acid mutarotase